MSMFDELSGEQQAAVRWWADESYTMESQAYRASGEQHPRTLEGHRNYMMSDEYLQKTKIPGGGVALDAIRDMHKEHLTGRRPGASEYGRGGR